MTDLLTAAKEAMEVFDEVRDYILNGRGPLEATLDNDQTNAVLDVVDMMRESLAKVSTAIAEAEKAEPVAWYVPERCKDDPTDYPFTQNPAFAERYNGTPLYLHPAPTIPETEKAEPVAWINTMPSGLVLAEFHKISEAIDYQPLFAHPASATPDWIRAVDEELVVCCIGIAESSDDYETARKKLHELIQWHVDVALNKAVNGGLTMVPIEPTKEMSDAFWSAYIPENKTAGAQASSFEDWWDFIHMYKAMLAAAPEVKP